MKRAITRGTTVFYMGEPYRECETEEEAENLAERLNDIAIY